VTGESERSRWQKWQLHEAAADGDLEAVDDLLRRKYPLNRFDDLSYTPLHHAVIGGHLHIVDRLLEVGADVNAHEELRIGDTPLKYAVQAGSVEIVERLVRAGADPTIPGWMGITAMDQAGSCPNSRRIRRLLRDAIEPTR